MEDSKYVSLNKERNAEEHKLSFLALGKFINKWFLKARGEKWCLTLNSLLTSLCLCILSNLIPPPFLSVISSSQVPISHLVPLDGHFVIREIGTKSRSHMPVCVFKGIASHSRVGACAHITANGCVLSHTQGRELRACFPRSHTEACWTQKRGENTICWLGAFEGAKHKRDTFRLLQGDHHGDVRNESGKGKNGNRELSGGCWGCPSKWAGTWGCKG